MAVTRDEKCILLTTVILTLLSAIGIFLELNTERHKLHRVALTVGNTIGTGIALYASYIVIQNILRRRNQILEVAPESPSPLESGDDSDEDHEEIDSDPEEGTLSRKKNS